MKRIFVENGKVRDLSEMEFGMLPARRRVSEIVKGMEQREIEAFHRERNEKFIRPLMERIDKRSF